MMTSRNVDNPRIYAVIPVYNEVVLIESFLRELAAKLSQISINYKIVFVDDGSLDNSKKIIQSFVNQLNIKFISFSRNFGQEAAIT
ncbi:glycosyltransferase, partial [Francisella tularensis subsp. holarctica]|uniref:glycosyltransferase n=1 Tax=Francisella tularensis TaxID=263 RepID=UPI002381BA24